MSQAASIGSGQPSQPRGEEKRRDASVCGVCGKWLEPRPFRHGSARRHCSQTCRRTAWERANPERRQKLLPLDPEPQPVIPIRDQRVPKARRRGFSEQAQAILTRLETGPCSNVEMAQMFPPATAWRSRLSDARFELRRRFGLRDTEDPIPGHDCGGGLVWHWISLC